jgi:hypothetical protein
MIVNNVIGLAKFAKAFNVPVILTTVLEGAGRGRSYHVDRPERRMATRLGARVYAAGHHQDRDRARWRKWRRVRLGDSASRGFQAVALNISAAPLP